MTKGPTSTQPSKLKFLPGGHLATNSSGLGRLFYKSSCRLQNFRRHGNQNGRNLEGWHMVHRSNRTASQDSQLFFVVCFQHNEHLHLSNMSKSLIVPVCTGHFLLKSSIGTWCSISGQIWWHPHSLQTNIPWGRTGQRKSISVIHNPRMWNRIYNLER